MKTESADFLRCLYSAIAQGWGAKPHQGEAFANAILTGDLFGQFGQGAAIVQIAHLFATHDQLAADAEPVIEQDGPSYAVLDGQMGLGQYVMTRAMDIAIEKAKESTIGTVWVHRWHDIGCAAAYTRRALAHNCVAMLTVTSVPLTAPWGGRDMLMSAAPFSFVCPAGEERPVIGDLALCGTWDFHMVKAVNEGKRLDRKLLVDPDTGELTDDPTRFIDDPSSRLTPVRAATVFPDHKIYGFNVFSEIMTGLLTPGGLTADQLQYPTRDYVEKGVKVDRGGGGYITVVDVSRLMPVDLFKTRVDTWIRTIKGSRLVKGAEEILLPGERAQRNEERCLAEGVEIRDEHWDNLERIAADLSIDITRCAERATFMENVFWLRPNIICGRTGPNTHAWNPRELAEGGIGAVLSVNFGAEVVPEDLSAAGIAYQCIPLSDNAPPQPGDFEICIAALPKGLAFATENIQAGKATLVHCRAGKDRTGMFLSYYLCRTEGLGVREAIEEVKRVRPIALTAEGYEPFAVQVLEALVD